MKNTTVNKTRLFSNIPISYSFFDKKNFVSNQSEILFCYNSVTVFCAKTQELNQQI